MLVNPIKLLKSLYPMHSVHSSYLMIYNKRGPRVAARSMCRPRRTATTTASSRTGGTRTGTSAATGRLPETGRGTGHVTETGRGSGTGSPRSLATRARRKQRGKKDPGEFSKFFIYIILFSLKESTVR